MRLSLYLPAPLSKITQRFAQNATSIYKEQGLIGHSAVDWDILYGAPIRNLAEGYCYGVKNAESDDPSRYKGVYLLVEGDNGKSDLAEVSYGHFSSVTAVPGRRYAAGEELGKCGNSGDVFAGGRYVSAAEKLKGSKAGTHLHGPQVRPVKRVKVKAKGRKYLEGASGTYKHEGFYLEIIDYENGTNGCIDPAPFFNGIVAGVPTPAASFAPGATSGLVAAMQGVLRSTGHFPATQPLTGFWGPITSEALRKFQAATGLTLSPHAAASGSGDATLGGMENSKPLVQSRTFWVAVATFAIGALTLFTDVLGAYVPPEVLAGLLALAGLVQVVLRTQTSAPISSLK